MVRNLIVGTYLESNIWLFSAPFSTICAFRCHENFNKMDLNQNNNRKVALCFLDSIKDVNSAQKDEWQKRKASNGELTVVEGRTTQIA